MIDRTLDLLAEAEIAIVTLPTVNMYLQDRTPSRTPRWRGVTVIQEMRQRGILVAAAGDNCRDSFFASVQAIIFEDGWEQSVPNRKPRGKRPRTARRGTLRNIRP